MKIVSLPPSVLSGLLFERKHASETARIVLLVLPRAIRTDVMYSRLPYLSLIPNVKAALPPLLPTVITATITICGRFFADKRRRGAEGEANGARTDGDRVSPSFDRSAYAGIGRGENFRRRGESIRHLEFARRRIRPAD